MLFRVLDSESDALPVGPQRKYWSASALEREDAKVAAFETSWQSKVRLVCHQARGALFLAIKRARKPSGLTNSFDSKSVA